MPLTQKEGPSFSGEAPCFRATPHNSASRFGERFFAKPRFEKRRNTLCISNFSNRRIGGKDPSKREDAIARCCLRTQTLNRKFTTSPSCMTYSLPSLRSRPFALALASVPQALRSSKAITSARMKPRSKSE